MNKKEICFLLQAYSGKRVLKKIFRDYHISTDATVVLLDDHDKDFSEYVVKVSYEYLKFRQEKEKRNDVDLLLVSNGNNFFSEYTNVCSIKIDASKWMKLLTYSTVRGMIVASLRFPEGRHGNIFINKNYVTFEEYIRYAIFNLDR